MLHRAAPLIRVEFGGVEKRKIFPATAPFHFIERVHTEVNEERPLKPHPRRLIRARQNFRRFPGDDGGGIAFVDHLLGGMRDRGGLLVRGRLTAGKRKIQQKDSSQPTAPGQVASQRRHLFVAVMKSRCAK
jgi:hypothetical protein